MGDLRIIASMSILRRFPAAVLLVAFGATLAVPVEALRCRTVTVCPMMAKAGAPCHAPATPAKAGAGMTVPIDCCRQKAVSPVAPSLLGTAATGFVVAFAAAIPATAVAAATALPLWRAGLDRSALLAVWRL